MSVSFSLLNTVKKKKKKNGTANFNAICHKFLIPLLNNQYFTSFLKYDIFVASRAQGIKWLYSYFSCNFIVNSVLVNEYIFFWCQTRVKYFYVIPLYVLKSSEEKPSNNEDI